MRLSHMVIGLGVRLRRDVELFPTGLFRAGLDGGVVIEQDAHDLSRSSIAWSVSDGCWHEIGQPMVLVRLDEYCADLEEWENTLQVWSDCSEQDESDCTCDAFEAIPAGAAVYDVPCERDFVLEYVVAGTGREARKAWCDYADSATADRLLAAASETHRAAGHRITAAIHRPTITTDIGSR
jgi:hypothetical protein